MSSASVIVPEKSPENVTLCILSSVTKITISWNTEAFSMVSQLANVTNAHHHIRQISHVCVNCIIYGNPLGSGNSLVIFHVNVVGVAENAWTCLANLIQFDSLRGSIFSLLEKVFLGHKKSSCAILPYRPSTRIGVVSCFDIDYAK